MNFLSMDMDNVKYLLLLAFAISVTSRRVYDVDVEDVPKKVFEISVSRTAHDVDEMLKVVSKGSWDSFKREYAKKYKNKTEENLRKKIYFENKRKISKHNQLYELGQTSFKLGLNEYSDLQGEEFVAAMCGSRYINSTNNFSEAVTFNAPDFDVPESMDWRTKGAVTPVKYQGLCGSCWAFSATGSLEGQVFRTTNKLVSLSEQNLIDCSVTYGNYGCDGGFSINAFKFIMDNGGIDTEESYPYEAVDATCSYKSIDSGAIVRAFGMIVPGSENELKKAVATIGPISVLLDASLSSFQQYKEGVYYDYKCSSSQLNHAVLVVGYGSTKNGLDYWIVKNSWGTSWGDDGYFLMARNERNNCGMTTAASYPLV